MTTLNRYIVNQRTHIKKKMLQPLKGFTNQEGAQAQWDDIAVTFTNAAGVTANFIFNNANKLNARATSKFTKEDRLDTSAHQLLMSYLLDVIKENISVSNKKTKFTNAKNFLIEHNSNVSSSRLRNIQYTIDNMSSTHALPSFFYWLHQNKMLATSCRPSFLIKRRSIRNKSGDEAIESENSKLPNEKSLLALGAIFHDVIPLYSNDQADISSWHHLTQPSTSQHDAFICTMSALAMSSPNRAAAEQVLLPKQRLKSYSEIVGGKNETVYYLHWRGSKGFRDNQKHFNAEMAESLDRALHYTCIVTEPARALARFYKKPSQPLKSVLGEFKPSLENLKLLNPTMDKPVTLIHLALLLGFFDGTDKVVRVTCNTPGATKLPNSKGEPKYIKPIAELLPFDKLSVKHGCAYASSLLGLHMSGKIKLKKYCNEKDVLTVAEFQNHFVHTNQANLTGYNKQQNKRVDYENALFTFTEKQLKVQQASHFLLVPISSLHAYFSHGLTKTKASTRKTIFERHGFSKDFSIKPHQFRHWQNDYLAKNGLPHLLITMLSGRKSAEQTLTYIHTTDAQNSSVISDILYNQETKVEVEDKIGIRIRSKDQYDSAIKNLTPTFLTEVGFCVQNLTLSPCTYMTEFETQCTLCPSSCHIAHDKATIDLLKKDLKLQIHNLEQVQKAINFTTSDGMQEWYLTHYRNTCLLKSLIETLSDTTINKNSIVRYLTSSNLIRITDLNTKTIIERKITLPNPKEALQVALEVKIKDKNSIAKKNFLSFLDEI